MIGTRAKLAVAVVGVLAVATALLVFPRAHPKAPPSAPPPSKPSGHGAGIDHEFASYQALFSAPEGATPCESAYNAFQNSIDVATQQRVKPVVISLAPHDEFITHCAALPSSVQVCLPPRYRRNHGAECARAKPPADVLREISSFVHMQPPIADPEDTPGPATSASAP